MPPSEYPSKMSSQVYRELLLRTRRTMDCSVNFSWSPTQAITSDPEAYAATAFLPSGGTIHIPEVNLTNIDDVISKMNTNVQHTAAKRDAHIYVSLREAAAQRPLEERNRIHIAETAHVGGHKYAANVLVYPRGEWLGLVQPEDAPSVIDAIFQQSDQPFDSNLDPLLPHHWRGRMNLDKEEQIGLYDRFVNSIR
ncbi:hypothetical protein ONZ45_g5883 [Pleurotus djamor]|nr:hypothetical protein ONZ45_g5883 [Pleurotus djamor]